MFQLLSDDITTWMKAKSSFPWYTLNLARAFWTFSLIFAQHALLDSRALHGLGHTSQTLVTSRLMQRAHFGTSGDFIGTKGSRLQLVVVLVQLVSTLNLTFELDG